MVVGETNINFDQLERCKFRLQTIEVNQGGVIVQARYEGTGHSDTTRDEWMSTQHRDTNAMLVGNPHHLKYYSVATGQSLARTRLMILDGMVDPLNAASPYCLPGPQ
jgi:splicing factor 3B subunit 5